VLWGVGVKWGNNLGCSDDNGIGGVVIGGIFLNSAVFTRSIDGDLDGDGTTTDLLALESVDGLLLFSLVANVDEAVSLALSGLTPPPSNNASRANIETSVSKESSEAGVVDVEAEVGNEENGLGGFADRILTGGTRETRSPRFALLGLGSILCGRIGRGSVCGGLSFAKLGPVMALKTRSGLW